MSNVVYIYRGFTLERLLIHLGLCPRYKRILARARKLYALVVAQARQPVFFREWAVRDDKDGRYEMLSLHLFLMLERLRLEPCDDPKDDVALLGQFLTEVAVADLEYNLREMGVGDLAVGGRVQKMTKRHYARLAMYHKLFGDSEHQYLKAEIPQALIDYVLSDDKGIAPLAAPHGAEQLAIYIRANMLSLAKQPISELVVAPNFTQSPDRAA
ncbi:MAG: hypothetical protein HRT36_03070 [Alphaproteobacteria bacterium]|nr:hypothetical protein [Alphaproteobacteria bacterium]